MADNQSNPEPAAKLSGPSNSTNSTNSTNENGKSLEQPQSGARMDSQNGGNRGRDRGRGRGRGRGGDRGRGGCGGRGNDQEGRHKKADMGRGEWSRTYVDKRKRNNDEQEAKRRKLEETGEDPESALPFSKEEIANEERKPKKKVAVLIGYAGTGYKGMQINPTEKTIEGDLFSAFVAAGAISKANADDPKKSSLVRCARTDKGVHAAGNIISLKLIVEDPDIVEKINEHLPPQIRVWGIERTTGAFSSYQSCDSRWYEYLIPTYSFIPPHPQSFLGKKLVDSSEQEGIHETYQARQADVADFWNKAEEEYISPVLNKLAPELRDEVMSIIHATEDEPAQPKAAKAENPSSKPQTDGNSKDNTKQEKTEETKYEQDTAMPDLEPELPVQEGGKRRLAEAQLQPEESPSKESKSSDGTPKTMSQALDSMSDITKDTGESEDAKKTDPKELSAVQRIEPTPLELAIKDVKAAYIAAKKAYRISDIRRKAVQDALNEYVGTQNFYNYTIQKTFKDPSAKRVIRSFKVGPDPIIINDTEWLSLKVHGQSFMMHQIRKMVAMVALVVRCGTGVERIRDSYGPDRISIPKAPGLGLLLERPVFDNYNNKTAQEFSREKLDFDKYEKKIDEFKQKEIYERIFRVENEKHEFHSFFHHVDHYRTDSFLWVTAGGIRAAKQFAEKNGGNKGTKMDSIDSDDEDRKQGEEEG